MTPFLIGIAGPSGSGKSELSRRLAERLPGAVSVLSLDSYYLPLDHLTPAERAARNFDHPDALDWAMILEHAGELAAGRAIQEPIYRFDVHNRAPGTLLVRPTPYVIIEGIMALHHPLLRQKLSLAVYIQTADHECYLRRLARDTNERGRSRESVKRQYHATVRPMAEVYVWPTREFADVVVSGVQPIARSVEAVLARLPGPSPRAVAAAAS